MKSKLFESLNDRQNIIDAYAKMSSINESEEDVELLSAPTGMKNPICIEDEVEGSKWVGLDEILNEFGDIKGGAEEGTDDYYFNVAYEYLGEDEIYKKLLEECGTDLTPSPEEISRAGGTYNKKEIYDFIVEFGKEYVEEIHKDDIEVLVPDWAMSYLVNGDSSGLTEDEIELVENWEDGFVKDGYEFIPGYENLGFCSNPDFGEATDCYKCYFRKTDKVDSEQNESVDFSEKKISKRCKSIQKKIDDYFGGSTKLMPRTIELKNKDGEYVYDEVEYNPSTNELTWNELRMPYDDSLDVQNNLENFYSYIVSVIGTYEDESEVSDSMTNKEVKKMLKENPNMKMICDCDSSDFVGKIDDVNESEEVISKVVGPAPSSVERSEFEDKVIEYFSSTAKYEQGRGRDIFFNPDEMKLFTTDEQWLGYIPRVCSQLAYSLKRRHGIQIEWTEVENGCIIGIKDDSESEEKDISEIRKYYSEKGYFDPIEDADKVSAVLDAGFTVKTAPNGDMKFVIEWER